MRFVFLTLLALLASASFSVAQGGIDAVRKRDGLLQVVDQQSQPVNNVGVQIDMTRRAFPFGVEVSEALLTDAAYREFVRRQAPLWWDWAVFGNESKWYSNEAQQGNVNFLVADAMFDLLDSWGFLVRGHSLFWAVPDFVQQWVKDLTYPAALQAAVDQRLDDAVLHFKDKFVHWDVNNEMVHGTFFQDRLGVGIRAYMHNRTKTLDPNVLTCVNDYNVISGGYSTQAFKDLVLQLESDGAQIDLLGVQCHMGVSDDAASITARLDSVAELGYPIWVTEWDVVAADPTVRADKLEEFYRAAFAHPAVEGILMWGFWAGEHWRGADAALVDLDWTVNEAGLRYDALMQEWWTNLVGATDSNGEFNFNGFHGNYQITLTPSGGSAEVHTIQLSNGSGAASYTLTLGTGAPEDTSAPTPNPMTWDVLPVAVGKEAITMAATTGVDPSGVEYYFANITDPTHDSGWLDTSYYNDLGITPGLTYAYQVIARDRSLDLNLGAWSGTAFATAYPPDNNILVNPGFEYGTPQGWERFGSSTILVQSNVVQAGNYACFVANRAATWNGVRQDLQGKMVNGGSYSTSVWVRLDNSSSDQVKMTIKQVDGAGTQYFNVGSATASNTGWTQLTGSFDLDVTGTLDILFIYVAGLPTEVDFYVDVAEVIHTGYWNGTHAPALSVLSESQVTPISARLNGRLDDAGAPSATLYAYWGTSDGGTTPVGWEHTATLGAYVPGDFFCDLNSLSPNQSYAYRFRAVSVGGDVWTSPASTVTAGDNTLIWVDFSHDGFEAGSQAEPCSTLTLAATWVATGGEVRLVGPQSTPETLLIDRAMRLVATGGTVSVGR